MIAPESDCIRPIGASPEYGKASFLERMTREIEHVKRLYPDALFIGLADGATDNWSFLNQHTSIQVTDFWHATEYLAQAGEAIFPSPRDAPRRKQWLEERCHKLKHLKGAAVRILNEIKDRAEGNPGCVITHWSRWRCRSAQA